MNGAAQTLIGSAPADIRDVGVNIGIGRIGELFQTLHTPAYFDEELDQVF
jgi:hypothetical protein